MRISALILAILSILASLQTAAAAEPACPNCAPAPADGLRVPYRWSEAGAIAVEARPRGDGWLARAVEGLDVRVSSVSPAPDLNGDGVDDQVLLLESRASRIGPYAAGSRWELLVLLGAATGDASTAAGTDAPAAAGVTFSLSLAVTGLAVEEDRLLVELVADGEPLTIGFDWADGRLHRADGGLTSLTHLVRRGETLSAIARRYGVSAADLSARNGLGNDNRLGIGQRLNIPPVQPLPVSVAGVPFLFVGLPGEQLRPDERVLPLRPAQHIVQPGERWEQIAARHRVALPALIDHNGLRLSSRPQPGQVLFIPGIPRDKTLYLTFDDGPHEEWTPRFLDLLARFDAHGTFFVNGVYADIYPALIQRAIDEGHAVANHSYYHSHFDRLGVDRVAWELISTQTAIGVDNQSPCFRPPYGILPPAAWNVVAGQGYEIVIWDIDSLDWQKSDAEAIAAPVREGAYDGAIVLMHDGGADERGPTLAALETVLTELGAQGYRFEAYCKR